jgi:hypothetical protein
MGPHARSRSPTPRHRTQIAIHCLGSKRSPSQPPKMTLNHSKYTFNGDAELRLSDSVVVADRPENESLRRAGCVGVGQLIRRMIPARIIAR